MSNYISAVSCVYLFTENFKQRKQECISISCNGMHPNTCNYQYVPANKLRNNYVFITYCVCWGSTNEYIITSTKRQSLFC